MADIIKSRRDTAENWRTANPTLAEGELGFETDTKRYKLGDGKKAWNDLEYRDIDVVGEISEDGGDSLPTTAAVLAKLRELGYYEDNPEYVRVITDSEGRLLFGIKTDGSIDWAVGVPAPVKEYIDKQVSVIIGTGNTTDEIDTLSDVFKFLDDFKNSDTLKALLGEKVDKEDGKSLIDAEFAGGTTYEDHPEFVKVVTDSEGRVLAGRRTDGVKEEKVGFKTPMLNVGGAESKAINDQEERVEVETDADGKIVSYRRKDGTKVENSLKVENNLEANNLNVGHLSLTQKGMTEFQKALKDSGFQPGGTGDWSDSAELHIPEPRCAMVNFTNITSMPTTKTTNAKAYLEFFDMRGNYFKKEVIVNAQGRSSLGHPKKNIAVDICNNNGWDDGDTFSLKIGNWVSQDSFHLKGFYNDPFRGLCPISYKLNNEILKTHGILNDYVWKKALINKDAITPLSTGCNNADDANELWSNGARCFPDGFPCIVYLNGEFYGIYSWQLKKDKDNYRMNKGNTTHIHLDGIVSTENILDANGDKSKIVWTTGSPEGFEVRNPKPKQKKDGWELTMMNGVKYDADANGGELIDNSSSMWDGTNPSHIKSNEVKNAIINLSKVLPTIQSAYSVYESSSKSEEDKQNFKTIFETYFDIDNLIDYLVLSDVLGNYDGFRQNVQWVTYDGTKWYLCAYDMDGVMGNWWELSQKFYEPQTNHYSYAQFLYLPIFYNDELEARYKELRDANIVSAQHIIEMVNDWLERIGIDAFEKEWKKWPGFIKNDNIFRLKSWLDKSISNMDAIYHYNKN